MNPHDWSTDEGVMAGLREMRGTPQGEALADLVAADLRHERRLRRRRRRTLNVASAVLLGVSVLVAVGAFIALAGCAPQPVEGVVEHKQHADSYTYYTYPCTGYNAQSQCTSYGIQPNVMPATWELCINGTDEDGKPATGCIEVGETRWNRYDEGDHYPDPR